MRSQDCLHVYNNAWQMLLMIDIIIGKLQNYTQLQHEVHAADFKGSHSRTKFALLLIKLHCVGMMI